MQVILVRHGAYAGGEADPGLSAHGFDQARALGRFLARQGVRPGAVVTSDYRRALETAQTILGEMGAEGTPHELKSRFSNDYLISHMRPDRAFEIALAKLGYTFVYDHEKKAYRIVISGSAAAKRLLTDFDEYTKDIEIVKGSMDDVFLNVTGRNILHTEGSHGSEN